MSTALTSEAIHAASLSPTGTVAITADGDPVTTGRYEVIKTFVRVVSWPRYSDRPQSQDVITVHVVKPLDADRTVPASS